MLHLIRIISNLHLSKFTLNVASITPSIDHTNPSFRTLSKLYKILKETILNKDCITHYENYCIS